MHKSISFVFFLIIPFCLFAQDIELESFASGFALPVDIVSDGSDRLYIVEKAGVIKIVEADGTVRSEPFLDITDRVNSGGSELGLLGLDFHPDYQNNGQFYVNYTNRADFTVIARFLRDPQDPLKGMPDSEDRMLQFGQPFNNHNGGDLDFGPDGYLYVAVGDGGSANDPNNNSQSINTYLGTLLRLDVDGQQGYEVPSDNPFVGQTGLDEIWSYGLRNPWRISFDRMTGDLWIGDVGQNQYEEIDFQPADSKGGENWGWKCFEGDREYITRDCNMSQEFSFPIHVYDNNRFGDGCSVTGGYVYRGAEFPDLFGKYIYCDYCSGRFWALEVTADDTINTQIGQFSNNEFGAFGEDVNGEMYVAALREGTIYKIKVPCALEVEVFSEDQACLGVNDGWAQVVLSDTTFDGKILWSNGDTTERITDLAPGKYSVQVTGGGCNLIDSITVNATQLTESCLLDTTSVAFCPGDTVELNACPSPEDYTYEWYKDGAVVPGQDGASLRISEAGAYAVAFKGECDLGISDAVDFMRKAAPPKPVITRKGDTLRADIIADSYEWFYLEDFYMQTNEPFVEFVGTGDYKVRGVLDGCKGPFSETISVPLSVFDGVYDDLLEVYPNPVEDELFVENRSNEALEIQMLDASGKVILIGTATIGKNRIKTASLSQGVYHLLVKGDLGASAIRIVK